MGFGISIWRLSPKKSKLKAFEKECSLCVNPAIENENFCEKCLNKSLKGKTHETL